MEDNDHHQVALEEISERENNYEDRKKVLEEIYALLDPQPEGFITSSRFAVCEGDMLMWDSGNKEPHYLFLFNDVLLVTKPKAFSINYHLVIYVQLRSADLVLEEVPDSRDSEFRLITSKKSISFFALTEEDKTTWVSNIRKSMEEKHKYEKQDIRSFSITSSSSDESSSSEELPMPKSRSRLVKQQYRFVGDSSWLSALLSWVSCC
eukprot:TRINITY_DN11659_c0_g1_i1.p1 TRINITY_DN11659_c0_g1~~TRINITY_DN11659_c0_g1_i1.p1  ORF type:complete len:207 (-),score=38.40 TRINITY_DN11659_c0_g1_i1:51-671(-)